MSDIKVGLIGFGNIGAGVVKLLQENADVIRSKVGTGIVLKRIADLDITSDRGVTVDPGVLSTSDVNDIFDDPEISVVIELIGGYEPAKSFVLKAIEKGKHIVTANKALLALHGEEIYAAAVRKGVEVQFEAAVGGGIPVLTAIKGNMAANSFGSVFGIMNGTCNYILTRMTQEGADFADVLKAAQELGYAEPDPTFDIEGVDTAHKLAILVSLCFGTAHRFQGNLHRGDFRYQRAGRQICHRFRLPYQTAGHRQTVRRQDRSPCASHHDPAAQPAGRRKWRIQRHPPDR